VPGTPQLFPSAPYLSDRARYPRGFTPARLRAVQSTTGLDPQWHGDEGAKDVAAIRDNLARSTAPVEHMQGVTWRTSSRAIGADEVGRYEPPLPWAAEPEAVIHVGPGQGRGGTPLHELGHHVSHEVARNPHSAYDDTVDMGREEAYAENYAETHFRDRRGNPVRVTRRTAEDWTIGGQRGGRYGGFHEGWDAERVNSPVLRQHHAQPRARRIAEQQTLW
jgi:hypothetical protein